MGPPGSTGETNPCCREAKQKAEKSKGKSKKKAKADAMQSREHDMNMIRAPSFPPPSRLPGPALPCPSCVAFFT